VDTTCRYEAGFELSKRQLEGWLRPLTDRERFVIAYRFGLIDGVAHTLQQTGDIVGMSREQVRHIEARALRKARSAPQ
jgi:RNA polymerase primary sigma factor